MEKQFNARLQLRAATTAEWSTSTAILASGEPALEIITDENENKQYLMKMGNGKSTFSELPYFHQYHIQILDHAPDITETNENTITFVIP